MKVDVSRYRSNHGAVPRGFGAWAFVFGKLDYDHVGEAWFPPGGSMMYGEAKKLALAEAKRRGVTLVAVCS